MEENKSEEKAILDIVRMRLEGEQSHSEEPEQDETKKRSTAADGQGDGAVGKTKTTKTAEEGKTKKNAGDEQSAPLPPTLERASANLPTSGSVGAYRVGTSQSTATRLDRHHSGEPEDDGTEDNSHSVPNEDGTSSQPRRVSMRTSATLESMGAVIDTAAHPLHYAEATLVVEDCEDAGTTATGRRSVSRNSSFNANFDPDEEAPVIVSNDVIVPAEPVTGNKAMNRRIAVAAALVALVIIAVLLGVLIPLSRQDETSNESIQVPTSLPPEDEVITFLPEPICYSHIPQVTTFSKACPDPLPQGSPLCQLSAMSLLEETPAAMMSMINAGSLRGDLLEGNFTTSMAQALMPFPNTVSLISLSGSLVLETLEDAINRSISVIPLKPSTTAAYPYAAGLQFDVNLTAPYGARVSQVQVNPGLMLGWSPIDLEANYRVATNSYLAGGGDGYFADVPEGDVYHTTVGVTDAFIDYCGNSSVLYPPTLEEMSTQGFIGLE